MNEWKKSLRCETSACIEADVVDGVWHLRNSKHPEQTITADWDEVRVFVAGVIAGDFDVA